MDSVDLLLEFVIMDWVLLILASMFVILDWIFLIVDWMCDSGLGWL